MNEFEQEKSKLHIDEALGQVLELINKKEYMKAFGILQPLTMQFEQGYQLENTAEEEFYSFTDNIEFFTKLIENANKGKTTNIVALSPSYGRMYHLQGYIFTELEKIEEAEKALTKALKWNPVSAGTYLEFAEIYKKASNWGKFLPLAQNALKYAKTSQTLARAYRGLGFYFCEQKNYPLAVALYMHSLQFEENREIVGNEVAYMYELSNKTLELPTPDQAVQIILESGMEAEISNYVFAGYSQFLQALKEAGETDAFNMYAERLKQMIFSQDKIEHLNNLINGG